MPFGPYKDMKDCISKNQDKKSPGGYCAAIHKKVTGDWPSEMVQLNTREKLGYIHEDMKGELVSDDFFDEWELKYGTKHEMEHTDNPVLAKKIAKDHLLEDPEYYSKLRKAGIEGAKSGPGIPDGTGPGKDSPKCPYNKKG